MAFLLGQRKTTAKIQYFHSPNANEYESKLNRAMDEIIKSLLTDNELMFRTTLFKYVFLIQ